MDLEQYLNNDKYLIVKEIDCSRSILNRIFILKFPEKYIDVTSYNCYFHNIDNRSRNRELLYYPYVCKRPNKFDYNDLKSQASQLDDNSIVFCSDIFDFYQKIRYNRKTKKYTI